MQTSGGSSEVLFRENQNDTQGIEDKNVSPKRKNKARRKVYHHKRNAHHQKRRHSHKRSKFPESGNRFGESSEVDLDLSGVDDTNPLPTSNPTSDDQ